MERSKSLLQPQSNLRYLNHTSFRTLVAILLLWNLRYCVISAIHLVLSSLCLVHYSTQYPAKLIPSHPIPSHRGNANGCTASTFSTPDPSRVAPAQSQMRLQDMVSKDHISEYFFVRVCLARPAATSHILKSGCSG